MATHAQSITLSLPGRLYRHAAAGALVMLLAHSSAGAADSGPQGSTDLSNASALTANGSAQMVGGSLEVLAGAGSVIVAGVETGIDGSVVLLRAAADGARASVRLSGEAARGASALAGASVEVVALSAGCLLVSAGKVIAFVPNQLGRALLHNERVAGAQAGA